MTLLDALGEDSTIDAAAGMTPLVIGMGMRFHPSAEAASAAADLTATVDICSRIVSLPVHHDMAPEDAARIVAAVRQGVRRA